MVVQSSRVLSPTQGAPGSARTVQALLGVSVVGVVLLLLDGDQRAVVAPALVAGATALAFFAILLRTSRVLPIDEIGTWYVAAVTVYTVLPLVVFLGIGMTYTPL